MCYFPSNILCPCTNYSYKLITPLIDQPYPHTNAYFYSFVPHTIVSAWNSLHQQHVTALAVLLLNTTLIIIIIIIIINKHNLLIINKLCLFIATQPTLAHAIYCVSFAQHKCFIDKKKERSVCVA